MNIKVKRVVSLKTYGRGRYRDENGHPVSAELAAALDAWFQGPVNDALERQIEDAGENQAETVQ